jgi:hypothetical protein
MRCPVCKADVTQGPQCRRCRADLSLLFGLERQRGRLLALARHRLAEGRYAEAARLAGEADAVQSDGESRRLLAVARLLGRDFAGAWEAYRRDRQASAG